MPGKFNHAWQAKTEAAKVRHELSLNQVNPSKSQRNQRGLPADPIKSAYARKRKHP